MSSIVFLIHFLANTISFFITLSTVAAEQPLIGYPELMLRCLDLRGNKHLIPILILRSYPYTINGILDKTISDLLPNLGDSH